MDADERERESIDPDAEAGQDRGRGHLAPELREPGQAAEVVDDPDGDGDRRTEQQPAGLLAEVQEGERRHEHAEEEREPAEARHRQLVHAPAPRHVDDAEPARHPPTAGVSSTTTANATRAPHRTSR